MKKKFKSFNDAGKFAQSLKLKSSNEWGKYCKSSKPEKIPTHPDRTYKNRGWISWGDFLGTGTIASQNMHYLSFTAARKYVHSLKIKNNDEWKTYTKSGKKPENIPANPYQTYTKKGWKGIPDWLGNGNLSNKGRTYLTYEKCQSAIQKLGITNQKEWEKYWKSHKKPNNIPSHPDRIYKEWKGWGNFLGTKRIANQNILFWSYEKSSKHVQLQKFKNQTEFRKAAIEGKQPIGIPKSPMTVYKNKGWISWGNWLGTGRIANQNRKYLTFLQSKKSIHLLKIKNVSEWRKWCKSDIHQENIPAHPNDAYKKEWIDWNDWLGTKNISNRVTSKNYLSFKEAKIEVRKFAKKYNLKTFSDWRKAVREGKIPKNIPLEPSRVYSKKRKK